MRICVCLRAVNKYHVHLSWVLCAQFLIHICCHIFFCFSTIPSVKFCFQGYVRSYKLPTEFHSTPSYYLLCKDSHTAVSEPPTIFSGFNVTPSDSLICSPTHPPRRTPTYPAITHSVTRHLPTDPVADYRTTRTNTLLAVHLPAMSDSHRQPPTHPPGHASIH